MIDIAENLKDEFISFYKTMILKISGASDIMSPEQFIQAWESFRTGSIDAAESVFNQYSGRESSPDKIEADFITVEICDTGTGRIFRRGIPVKFTETDNGIILSGENLSGEQTEIVLLSDTALRRIHELQGKEENDHLCDGH